MILTKVGRCACPPGTTWQRRECVADTSAGGGANTSKSPPAERRPPCPRGQVMRNDGRCVDVDDPTKRPQGIIVCPADRPIGKPPKCCPRGSIFQDGTCVVGKPQGGGSNPSRDPDRGKVEQVPKPKVCPPDRPIGKYPNCCPSGTILAKGKCFNPSRDPDRGKVEQVPKPNVCPADRPVGDYPNCCPRGYTPMAKGCVPTKRDKFEPSDADKAKTSPGDRITPPTKLNVCPPDRPVGTYPNCCPPGTIYTDRGCAGGGYNTSRDPPPPNRDKILTQPTDPIGDMIKCPTGQRRNSNGECDFPGPN